MPFEIQEDLRNQKFEEIQMPLFSPAFVLSVTLHEFRNVTYKGWWNYWDTPDVMFEISCPEIKQVHKTRFIKRNLTGGNINEKFNFVFSNNHEFNKKLVFQVFDRDTFTADDFLGKTTIDVSDLSLDGEPQRQTLQFQNDSKPCGTLDVELHKERRTTPDFRLSLGLCPEEIEFRKKRIPIVCNAMKEILGKENGPRDEVETPIVSLVGSGGGYRAMIGMSGAMEALNDAGLLDIFTYNCGLSGSAWYLSAAYAHQGLSSKKLKQFHDGVKERLDDHLMWKMFDISTYAYYSETVANFLKVHDLPKSIVNFFPGFLVGQHLFGEEKLDVKLTDLAAYVQTGEVPYPLMVALNVKDTVSANKCHAYVERSPHEIYLPSYGIGLKPEDEGTVWKNGIKLRSSTEYPLHFTVGMTGCAFSILLNQYYKNGTECGVTVSNLKSYDRIRVKDRNQTNKKRSINESSIKSFDLPIESDLDSDDSEFGNKCSDDELKHAFAKTPVKRKRRKTQEFSKSSTSSTHVANPFKISTTDATDGELPFVAELIKNIFSKIYNDRNAVIGRTAKVPNFLYNYDNLKRFYLNPFGKGQNLDGSKQEVVNDFGHKCVGDDVRMSTTTKNLSFADAGIFKNVPTDAVLRPQRGTDIMIVMDFNYYESDKKFNYKPLLAAAAHSWQSGLKFPKFDVEKIKKGEPKELHIFPSDEDDCPTVLWFTLCNKKFKNLENYKPRSPENKKNKKFNDFPVFGSESNFSSFRFQYDKYHFDQLRELMYYNVSSHIEEITEALIEATERKKKRLDGVNHTCQTESLCQNQDFD